jgi:hypothetical protein
LPTSFVSASSLNQSHLQKLIAEAEKLLDAEIPQAVYKPVPHVKVLDVAHCLRSHLNHVKANHKLESCKPYTQRLINLCNYVRTTRQQRSVIPQQQEAGR